MIYKTIEQAEEGIYREKGSKFIGYVFPMKNVPEFNLNKERILALHPKARHACVGYIIGYQEPIMKNSDDGEPSGSAGLPILNTIKSNGLTNTGVIVIRYFGGTKLGVPGLIRAYKTATQSAIDAGRILTKETICQYQLNTTFSHYAKILDKLKNIGAEILGTEFGTSVTLNFEVSHSIDLNKIKLALAGALELVDASLIEKIPTDELNLELVYEEK